MKICYESGAGMLNIPHVTGIVRNGITMVLYSLDRYVVSYPKNQKALQYKETLLIHSAWHFCK